MITAYSYYVRSITSILYSRQSNLLISFNSVTPIITTSRGLSRYYIGVRQTARSNANRCKIIFIHSIESIE